MFVFFFPDDLGSFSCVGLDLHLNHSPELVSVKLNVRLKVGVSNCLLEIRCYTLTHVSANPAFGKLTRLLFVFAFASIMSLVCFLSLPNILISFFFYWNSVFSPRSHSAAYPEWKLLARSVSEDLVFRVFIRPSNLKKNRDPLCVRLNLRYKISLQYHTRTASFHCVQLDVVQSCLTLWEQNLSLFVPFPDN